MSGAGGDPAERRRFGVQPDSHQIFVGNLPQDISEPELTEHFSPFGEALKGLSLVINALLLAYFFINLVRMFAWADSRGQSLH